LTTINTFSSQLIPRYTSHNGPALSGSLGKEAKISAENDLYKEYLVTSFTVHDGQTVLSGHFTTYVKRWEIIRNEPEDKPWREWIENLQRKREQNREWARENPGQKQRYVPSENRKNDSIWKSTFAKILGQHQKDNQQARENNEKQARKDDGKDNEIAKENNASEDNEIAKKEEEQFLDPEQIDKHLANLISHYSERAKLSESDRLKRLRAQGNWYEMSDDRITKRDIAFIEGRFRQAYEIGFTLRSFFEEE
jgi:hypothetical protein